MEEINTEFVKEQDAKAAGRASETADRAADQAAGAADRADQAADQAAGAADRAEKAADRAVQPAGSETEYSRRMRDEFGFFAPAALIYACFYAFCTFKNPSGVTFSFFTAGSLLFFSLCISRLGISLKKGSFFYMISIMLLGVSTFCTDDTRIIILNKTGIFLLTVSLLLEQLYDTSRWRLGKFLGSIITVTFAALGELGRPFADGARYRKERGNGCRGRAFDIAIGLLIGVPLVLLVGAVLGSADVVFRQMITRLMEAVSFEDLFRAALRIAFLFFASYCGLSYLCRKRLKEEVPDRRNGEPVPAITVSAILTALYLTFSVIQILYLFIGGLQLPEDYTYAMYAREGFFQLLAVSVLNLVIVLVMLSRFKESRVLKLILTLMSLCTFIMIASSAMRMVIYIRYYYLTFLRIFVLWSLAVLFLLFLGVIANIFRERFPLFRYSAAVVTVCFLALSFSHPDYWIAKVNIAGITAEEMEYGDYWFLSALNADAAPVLIPYLDGIGYDFTAAVPDREETHADNEDRISTEDESRSSTDYGRRISFYDAVQNSRDIREAFASYYLTRLQDRTGDMSRRTFNISRYMARKALEERLR